MNVKRWWICRSFPYRSATSKLGVWQCSCLLLQQASHGSRIATAGPVRRRLTSVGVVRTQCALLCGGFTSHRRKYKNTTRDSPEYINQDRRESYLVATSKCSPAFSFPQQCSVGISLLPYTCHMPCQSHPPLFNRPDNINWGLQIEYCQHKPEILHHEMLMYVGTEGQIHASWNALVDGSKNFGYPEFVSDFSRRS
jgi:hypothetical protein